MRRAFIAALAALLLLAGGWTAYWHYAAGRIEAETMAWIAARRLEGFTIIFDQLSVGGFPFDFRVRTQRVLFARGAPSSAPWEARLPEVTAETRAWDLRRWRLDAPSGGKGRMLPTDVRPLILIEAATLDGSIEPAANGNDVALAARDLVVEGEVRVTTERATAKVFLPARAPLDHREAGGRAQLRLEKLLLPVEVPRLGRNVESIDATAALKGAIPPGPPPAALAAWRDSGGTLEVEALRIVWGALDGSAEGTLALDRELQPVGAGTARLAGWGDILDALVASRQMREGDAALARIGLALMARPGPGGRSQLEAPVTIQNGTLSIAKQRVARLPRFTWE
jgi:hypothetical protein